MMLQSFVWILFGLLAVYGTLWTFLWVSNLLDRRKLRNQGRIVTWETALARTQSGDGYFLFCRTSLGNLWWVPGKPTNDVIELYKIFESRRTLVTLAPRDARKVLAEMRLDDYCRDVPNLDFRQCTIKNPRLDT